MGDGRIGGFRALRAPPGPSERGSTNHSARSSGRAGLEGQFVDYVADGRVPLARERPHEATALPTIGRASPVVKTPKFPATGGHIAVISDLDQTLIPRHDGDDIPRPFVGVAALLHELQGEQITGREDAGYTHYVTARSEGSARPLPGWLARHEFPRSGNMHTGPESRDDFDKAMRKIETISALMRRDPGRTFVLFGDSSHVDPFVYAVVQQRFPEQVAAAFIHAVDEIPEGGYPGLEVIGDYLEAALELGRRGVLDRQAVERVFRTAELEGSEIPARARDALTHL